MSQGHVCRKIRQTQGKKEDDDDDGRKLGGEFISKDGAQI